MPTCIEQREQTAFGQGSGSMIGCSEVTLQGNNCLDPPSGVVWAGMESVIPGKAYEWIGNTICPNRGWVIM